MSDQQPSSEQGEGATTTGHGPSRNPSETPAIDANNLNNLFDRIQDRKTMPENQSFLQEQPDFKEMQARRGTLMQNLWENFTTRNSEKK